MPTCQNCQQEKIISRNDLCTDCQEQNTKRIIIKLLTRADCPVEENWSNEKILQEAWKKIQDIEFSFGAWFRHRDFWSAFLHLFSLVEESKFAELGLPATTWEFLVFIESKKPEMIPDQKIISTLTKQLAQQEIQLNIISTPQRLGDFQERIQEAAAQIASLQEQIRQIIQQIIIEQRRFAKLENQLEIVLIQKKRLGKELQTANETIKDASRQTRQRNQTITRLETNLANSERTLTASQTATTNLRQEITELKKDSVSKKELETEQKKLQITKDALKTSQDNFTNLEQAKKATEENLLKTTQTALAQEQQKEQLQKDLTQSRQQLAQVQETQPLLEQKIQDLETQLFNLAKQKLKGKKEASELVAQLETNCQTHQETLTRKSKELSKLRLEVVSLQGQLKKKSEPEPNKPSFNKNEPISPWLLATLALVVIGGLWLINRKGGKDGN